MKKYAKNLMLLLMLSLLTGCNDALRTEPIQKKYPGAQVHKVSSECSFMVQTAEGDVREVVVSPMGSISGDILVFPRK